MAVDARLSDYVSANWPTLVRYAAVVCGDPIEAEDLVQSVLVKVAVRWPLLRDKSDLDGYIHTAIVRAEISRWRRRKVAREAPVARTTWHDETARADTALDVLAALKELPARQRAVLALRYLDDRTEAQTAEAMGCSVGTVKSQTSKALQTLRNRWPDLAEAVDLDRSSEKSR